MTVLEIARGYVRAGLSVIPILPDGTKKPACAWKEYQRRLPGPAELERWFSADYAGVAIIGGRVSGGLEVLDFETAAVYRAWSVLVEGLAPGLLSRLPLVWTPSGGTHAYYRVGTPSGNLKLARTAAGETLIETRGEGGYVLAPGCPPACHPSGNTYRLSEQNPGLDAIPVLHGEL